MNKISVVLILCLLVASMAVFADINIACAPNQVSVDDIVNCAVTTTEANNVGIIDLTVNPGTHTTTGATINGAGLFNPNNNKGSYTVYPGVNFVAGAQVASITLKAGSTGSISFSSFTFTDADSYAVLSPTLNPSNTITVSSACVESWSCGSWTACVSEQKTRTCTDANSCGTIANKPTETESCTVTSVAPEGSCSDGILNQDETGVDCGGSCSACAPPALTCTTATCLSPASCVSDVCTLTVDTLKTEIGTAISDNTTFSTKFEKISRIASLIRLYFSLN